MIFGADFGGMVGVVWYPCGVCSRWLLVFGGGGMFGGRLVVWYKPPPDDDDEEDGGGCGRSVDVLENPGRLGCN